MVILMDWMKIIFTNKVWFEEYNQNKGKIENKIILGLNDGKKVFHW